MVNTWSNINCKSSKLNLSKILLYVIYIPQKHSYTSLGPVHQAMVRPAAAAALLLILLGDTCFTGKHGAEPYHWGCTVTKELLDDIRQ